MNKSETDSRGRPKPSVLVGCMANWYLDHTAKGLANRNALSGFWTSTGVRRGIDPSLHKRVWPYHMLKLPTYYLPFINFEENTRWQFLPAFDAWMKFQSLPAKCNVVMGPMGSCTPLFNLADRNSKRVVKVFDAPNSHPFDHHRLWQDECDRFLPGYKIPLPLATVRRMAREIERADLVLCPSIFVRDSMVDHGVLPENCFVLPFGTNTDIFRPRTALPDNPLFVCVGSVCLRKGHQYLLPAFEKIKKEHPKARLVLVGGTRPDFEPLWAKWEGVAEYHEKLPHSEISKLLQQSTGFVLASVEEGFARVLAEAMACALPILATHETGATTVVKNLEHGLIVPSRDENALYEGMKRLIDNPEENLRMGEAASRVGGYSWQEYADRLLERLRAFF